jgi:hypothetical protein
MPAIGKTLAGVGIGHISVLSPKASSASASALPAAIRIVGQAGSVCVSPSGYDETHFAIAGSKFEAIVVELDPTRLETLLERPASASTETLAPQIVVRDRYIAMLLRAMASEVAQGCPAGALYGQALSLALATYLERRFSVKGRAEKKRHLRLVWAGGASLAGRTPMG